MKKLLKVAGIIVGSLAAILLIGLIALPLLLPLDKIKVMATEKISEAINREIKIEKVSFNLFEGIKLNGLTVSNRPGFVKKDFITADAIVLRYAFWPIFQRQLIVKEISLVKPEILIEKSAGGEMSFADLTQKKGPEKAAQANKGKAGFSLIVDSFSIKDARISYADYGTKQTSEIKNANLRVGGITLFSLRPIDFKFSAVANYQGKDIPVSLNGPITLDLAKETVSSTGLILNLAGETAILGLAVVDWKTGPAIDLKISSQKLSIDPLLAIFAASSNTPKKKAAPGELTRSVNKFLASLSTKYRANILVKIRNLSLLGFSIDNIDLDAALTHKQVKARINEIALYDGTLSGQAKIDLNVPGVAYELQGVKLIAFNSAPFFNDVVATFLSTLQDSQDLKDKVNGRLDANLTLSGRGIEPQDIFANAVAAGSLSLTGGELKKLKTLAQVGKTIGSDTLQGDIKFKDINLNFALRDRVLTIKNFRLNSSQLEAGFNGGVDIGGLKWVAGNRLSLRLAPSLIGNLSKEFDLFKDKDGWLEALFEITGSLKLPIPKPILDKPIEKAIGKLNVKIEAKKVEIEQQATEQIKTEAKKQFQNLIKF